MTGHLLYIVSVGLSYHVVVSVFRASFVKMLIDCTKKGLISLISMDANPGNYHLLVRKLGGPKTVALTHAEVTVIYMSQTLATLGLPCFSQIFQQGAYLIRVVEIVGSTVQQR